MTAVGRWLPPAALALLLAGCAGGPGADVDSQEVAEANADLGIEYLRNGDEPRAIRTLEKALRHDSGHVDAHWALAIAYARQDQPDAADRHYRRALDQKPRPEIRNSYGVFLCQQGRAREAVEHFQRVADDPKYPGPADALANAGQCLARAGEDEDAERYFRRALERNPQHRPTLAALARRNLEAGESLRARGFFQRLEATESPETPLDDEWLLLGARIEAARGDREAATAYLERYNERNPDDRRTLDQLEDDA